MTEKFDPSKHIRTVTYTRKDGSKVTRKILDTGPRLAWFRSEHPAGKGWQIITECLRLDEKGAQFFAKIINPEGQVIATGHRLVYRQKFANYPEKAETQAIGRALAAAGYGTLEALDMDTENDVGAMPDTPVEEPGVPPPPTQERHWVADSGQRTHFWAYARSELGLTSEDVHKALGVESLYEFGGTMEDAKAILGKYVEEELA